MKMTSQHGGTIALQKGQFPGWYWETTYRGYTFRADKESPKGYYRLYAVLGPNVFHWVGNRETLTQCVFESEDIATSNELIGKYFFD